MMPAFPPDLFAVILSISLVAPALPMMETMAVAMPLCNGGVIVLKTDTKTRPGDPKAACHAACLTTRDDDDGDTSAT